MEIILKRTKYLPQCTHGELWIDGQKYCDTLEPYYSDIVERDPNNTQNVRCVNELKNNVLTGIAIPENEYTLSLTMSKQFNRVLPILNNVPYFIGIRIHAGNTHRDTSGCILVGEYYKDDEIRFSKNWEKNLFVKLENYIRKHPMEALTIKVENHEVK